MSGRLWLVCPGERQVAAETFCCVDTAAAAVDAHAAVAV